jgi:glutathione peroxidase
MKIYFKICVVMFFSFTFFGCFDKNKALARPANPTLNTQNSMFYDFKMLGLSGETVDFSQFKGKKVVILNVASKCGYTPQYADFEAFYAKNSEKVVVLGFPANQFLSQEPGSNAEIGEFCQKNYGVTFPMFEKVEVKGSGKCALYQWLSDKSKNGWNEQEPTWNFCKYVINEGGELTHFFASAVKPTDAAFLEALK